MRDDLVAVVEAAYAPAADPSSWLENVANAALPALQRGGGVHAYFVDLNKQSAPLLRDPLLVGAPAAWTDSWREQWWDPFMRPMSAAHARLLHSLTSVCHTTDVFAAAAANAATYDEYLSRVAKKNWGSSGVLRGERASATVGLYPDSFNVACLDGEGVGCVLVANMPEPACNVVPRGLANVWAQVAAHVATGFRILRTRTANDPLVDAEAIFDDRGRAVHATGRAAKRSALDAIREVARATHHARTRRARRDVASALEAWRAMVLGRWSVVDCFDHDGRRFVVARPNEPQTKARALSPRQAQIVACASLGHSNKLIAYELGLSPSTVASHLASAAQKLGVKTRLALVTRARKSASEA